MPCNLQHDALGVAFTSIHPAFTYIQWRGLISSISDLCIYATNIQTSIHFSGFQSSLGERTSHSAARSAFPWRSSLLSIHVAKSKRRSACCCGTSAGALGSRTKSWPGPSSPWSRLTIDTVCAGAGAMCTRAWYLLTCRVPPPRACSSALSCSSLSVIGQVRAVALMVGCTALTRSMPRTLRINDM